MLGVELIKLLEPGQLPRVDAITVDQRVLWFALALSVFTGVLFGLAPAVQAIRVGVGDALKSAARAATVGRRQFKLREALVISEIAIAFILLVGAGLLFNSFVRLMNVDPGFNPDNLSSDGKTLLQRALEWGGGAGNSPQQILLVVADATSLTAQDTARKTLIEGWGYTVNMISASDSQANFDTAVAAASAAYVVMQDSSTALGTKLRDATIAVVNEEAELRQDIGFSANRDWPSTRDTVDIVDNSHYITSPFATGLLTIATAPIVVVTLSGQMASGLRDLAH